MPSGYTYKLYENEQSFEEFVWDCARGMGAFYHLHEESPKKKLTLPKNNDYYTKALREASIELNQFLTLSKNQLRQKLNEEYETKVFSARKDFEKSKEQKARFVKMLRKVEKWEAPLEYRNFKKFLVEQLKSTINFHFKNVTFKVGRKPSLQKWTDQKRKSLEENMQYYMQKIVKEKQKFDENIDWIKKLDSLIPCPEKLKGW